MNNSGIDKMLIKLMRCTTIEINESLFEAWIQTILKENNEIIKKTIKKYEEFIKNINIKPSNIESDDLIQILSSFIQKIPKENFSSCSNFLMESINYESDWNLLTNNDRVRYLRTIYYKVIFKFTI